jgi:hypothetical protein
VAVDHPEIADGRTLRSLKPAEEQQPKSKSEMTMAEKILFIKLHGSTAFANLPLRPQRIVEVRTQEDFRSLPTANKMQLIAEHGPDWVGRLPKAETEELINRRRGMLINKVKIKPW